MTPTQQADAALPASHPFSRHLARVAASPAHTPWAEGDQSLPALYLSHGAPPVLTHERWMGELHGWARSMSRPRAILIVSAHWESDAVAMTGSGPTELVHDYGGFDPLFTTMRYDTPDAAWLASRVRAVLPDGTSVHEHSGRGLDHGAWVPLKAMYPEADVPVIQLSLPTADPERLLRLGEALRPLRSEGVLIIGSGFMTHGLPFLDWSRQDEVPAWSREFDDWAADALHRGDVAELQRYRTQPSVRWAHPTVEHYTPLFVTLGAATDPTAVETVIDGYWIGLSRRSFQVA